MGYKNVCLNCRRVESLGTDFTNFRTGGCPECSARMRFVDQKFRPPKKTNDKLWAVAELLISNGFTYYTIRDDSGMPVDYPTTIDDARLFIKMYVPNIAEHGTRRKHDIEKQILELESRPANDHRDSLIRELKASLSRLTCN